MLVGQQFDLAVVMFYQSGTILDPIAAVVIGRLPDATNDGTVDVATENALNVETARVTDDGILVGADETDRILDPSFDRLAQRPVFEAKNTTRRVHKRVQCEQELVAKIAQQREPLDILNNGVELMPVKDQNTAPIRRDMNRMLLNRDRTIRSEVAGKELVVISRNVDHPGPFARLAQNFLDDVVVLLWPVNPAPQRPDINQVADNVERVELVFLQEVEKRRRAATSGAEMDI